MVYVTIQEVIQTAGIYKGQDDLESVGTGDDAETQFSLDHNPVVEGSETIYLAGTATTAFTMNYTTGEITFTAAPGTDVLVTATYWYFSGVTINSDVVSDKIEEAEEWVDEYTGRAWGTETVTDEVLDGTGTDTFYIRPDHTPLISLTALTIGTTSITTGYVYVYNNIGKLILSDDAEESTFKDTDPQYIKVSYTYGETTTPKKIRKLTEYIAAIDCITSVTGGTFDDVTSWQVGDVQASVGEPWTNLDATTKRLYQEIQSMLKHLKKRPVIM